MALEMAGRCPEEWATSPVFVSFATRYLLMNMFVRAGVCTLYLVILGPINTRIDQSTPYCALYDGILTKARNGDAKIPC